MEPAYVGGMTPQVFPVEATKPVSFLYERNVIPIDLGTIWASVGLKTAPLEAGVTRAKGTMRGLDASLSAQSGIMSDLQNQWKGYISSIPIVGNSLARLGAGSLTSVALVGAAIGGIGVAIYKSVEAAKEMQVVDKETNAILQTTGGVSNMTADSINKLAGKVQGYSGIQRTTVKGAEQLLLGFVNVRNEAGKGRDIFTRATEAAADLSKQFGTDMPANAKMLGKALQDPEKGMTMLKRAGVVLTAAQKDLITQFLAVGDVVGAQGAILDALDTSYGKVAEAYGNTLAGAIDRCKGAWHDLAVSVGNQVLPALSTVADKIASWDWGRITKDVGVVVSDIGKVAGAIGDLYSQIVQFGGDAATGVVNAIENIKRVLSGEPTIGAEHRIADETKKGMDDTLKVIQTATPATKSAMAEYASVLATLDKGPTPKRSAAIDALDGILKGILAKIPEAKGKIDQFSNAIIREIEDYGPEFATAGADTIGQYAEELSRSSGLPQGVIKAMLLQIQSFMKGNPITPVVNPPPPVKVTVEKPPPITLTVEEKNINDARKRSIGGWAAPLLTPTVDESNINAARARATGGWFATLSVNPLFHFSPSGLTLDQAAEHIKRTLSGTGANVNVGIDTAKAKYEEDTFSWEQQIAETERQIADLKKQGAAQDDARIKNLEAQRDIQQNEKDLIDKTYQVSYAGMNRELEKQNKLLEEAKTKEEEAARKREDAISKWKDGMNGVKSGIEAIISKQEDYKSKLGSMKLTGEGAATDKAFSQDEDSKALQYQIMQAEDAHNYALAAKLTLQKEALDRKKEEEALSPAALTREKQHYAIEKMLTDQQEMSYKKIRAEIIKTQNSLKTKYNWVNNITKALHEQIKTVKELKKEYDKLNKSKPAGSTKVASLSTPSGGGATVVHVNSILDGKIVAKSVTKILGGTASAYAASGGRY